jgi:RNA polymerase-binding transcription factor DksA
MPDFTNLKIKLEEQLNTIVTELETIGIYNEANDDWEPVPDSEESAADADENENADYNEDFEERTATLETLEREYKDIKRALAKMATGTYGICEISGQPIEMKRLEARPDARTCIAHMNEESELPM